MHALRLSLATRRHLTLPLVAVLAAAGLAVSAPAAPASASPAAPAPAAPATSATPAAPVADAWTGQVTEFPYPATNYQEDNRGQFHFSSRGGWMNDVNAPIYIDGTYHLYYQSNPHGLGFDTIHWGHATSTDLVHWVQRPIALAPEVHPVDLWSGGGILDTANASGLGDGTTAPLVVFSGTNGVRAFYSLDGGYSFDVYDGGRKLVTPAGTSRDPQVSWDAVAKAWVMTVWSDEGGNGVNFYRSTNLLDWAFTSRYRADWLFECPQLRPMTVEGTTTTKWILNTASGEYSVGTFNGTTFVPDAATTQRFNTAATGAGGNYYAGLAFQNLPGGRTVSMAWQGGNAGSVWTGNTTFPVEQRLVRAGKGLTVRSLPVSEIRSLYTRTQSFGPGTWSATRAATLLTAVDLDLADVVAVIDTRRTTATTVGFRLHTGANGWADRTVAYDRVAGTLDGVPLPARADGTVEIRMLVDRGQLEVFGNGGATYASYDVNFDTLPGGSGMQLVADGSVTMSKLAVHRLASTWTRGVESTLRSNATGTWYAASGTWSDVMGGKQGTSGGDAFYLNTQTGTDFTYEGDVTLVSGVAAAITFRANADASRHYTVNVDADAGVVKLWRPGRDIATSPLTVERGRSYHLRVRAEGDHFQVWLDEGAAPIIDAHDDTIASGQFGVNLYRGTAVVQDLEVGPLTPPTP